MPNLNAFENIWGKGEDAGEEMLVAAFSPISTKLLILPNTNFTCSFPSILLSANTFNFKNIVGKGQNTGKSYKLELCGNPLL